MSVTLNNADSALKDYYLSAVSEQLKLSSPFLSKIKQSTEDVWGKEVKKLAVYGINGGIGAGTEDGILPNSAGNNYQQFSLELKNLYGTIEISDKAVRASENNSGAFVNLLNAEMEGLVKSGSFNMGRMLFGNGSGVLARVNSVSNGIIVVDSSRNLAEGMVVDFINASTGAVIEGCGKRRITILDKTNKVLKVDGTSINSTQAPSGTLITLQGSYNKEITGLGAIFEGTTLYGLSKNNYTWLNPYKKTEQGELTEMAIQKAIDTIEQNSGSAINLIVCSYGVRRALLNLLSENKRVVNSVELEGGFKAISFNGIPVVADRFCPEGTMYLLNTDDFTMHQLCDWQWLLSDDGKALQQVAGKPVYTATLVKYAELLCSRPCGQGMISGITEE